MYAPSVLTIAAGTQTQPLLLDIAGDSNGGVILGINGAIGQKVVLQQAADLSSWNPVLTNVLTTARWEVTQPADGTNAFYRAVLLP